MKLMSIKLLVLSTALMLLLTACTATIPTPTPDAEATLVARVAATIIAISSLTPVPADTPTATATPTPMPVITPLPGQPFVVENKATAVALRGTPMPTATSAPAVTKGRIAFTSDRDGHAEIYVMNADGTDQTRLTNNSALDIGAAWSPE